MSLDPSPGVSTTFVHSLFFRLSSLTSSLAPSGKLLNAAGFPAPKPSLPTIISTFFVFSGLGSLCQWAYNEYTIRDLRLYGAWDTYGPIPEIDIYTLKTERAGNRPQATTFEDFLADSAREDELNQQAAAKRKEQIKNMPWWTWTRFHDAFLPKAEHLGDREYLKRLDGVKHATELELARVRKELEQLGEVALDIADIDLAAVQGTGVHGYVEKRIPTMRQTP